MPGLGQASFLGVSCLASSYLCSSLCWRCRCAGWSPQDFIFCPHCLPWGRAGLSGQQWVWVKASFATPFLLVPVLAVLPYFLYSFLLFVFDYAGLLFIVVCGLLIVVASLAVAPRLQSSGCGCCDVRAQLPQGMWTLSWSGIEPCGPRTGRQIFNPGPPVRFSVFLMLWYLGLYWPWRDCPCQGY